MRSVATPDPLTLRSVSARRATSCRATMPRMFRLLPLAAALIAALAIACAGSDGDEPAPPGTPLPDATTIAAAGCAPARPRAAGVSRETLMIGGLERS